MGLYAPTCFAARVSKPLESFSVSCLCSRATLRALVSSADGMVSAMATAYHQLIPQEENPPGYMLTGRLETQTPSSQRLRYA